MSVSQAARTVALAFFNRQPHRTEAGLTSTGTQLALYGHVVAEWRPDGLWVRVNGIETPYVDTRGWRLDPDRVAAMRAGDFGGNPTTRAKLSLVPGVDVSQCKGKLFLNGEAWDGTWKRV